MEDSSSNTGSEGHRDRVSDLKKRHPDCSADPTDRWQSDVKLGDCMLQLFDAGLWTDVSFRCSDQTEENPGDRIYAHKIVLAARSPVFRAMFFGPCKDSNTVIEVQDADSQDFDLFLRLLYSDQYHMVEEHDDLVNVLDIAHKYQVTHIVDKCCEELAELIDEENACSILERALLFDNKYLINQASDFIDENANKVLQRDDFLYIPVTCLAYILKGDTFYAKEYKIFERAIEWAKKAYQLTDGQVLRKTLGEAFFYLRTPVMSLKDFVNCTKGNGYYAIEEYEDIVAFMGMPQETKPKCNSTQKRLPLNIKIARLPVQEAEKKIFIKNGTIAETVSISSVVDIYLTSVTLLSRQHIVYPETLFTNVSVTNHPAVEGRYGLLSNEFEIKDLPVSVTLKLGDMPTIEREVPAGPTEPCIRLTEPFFLSAKTSVKLRVDMELDKIPKFKLKAFQCLRSDELKNTVPDTVKVKTEANSARVVQSLEFKCVSNRD